MFTDMEMGKIKSAIKILKWCCRHVRNEDPRMLYRLLFEHVIMYEMARITCDVQNQGSENIAIEYKKNFGQPPPEPLSDGSGIARGFKCAPQTSKSTRPGHFKCD